MPSGFVEVSGYSKSDLDAAYARGLAEGGSAVKGNATQSQVLQGYTFSSAAVGSNKSGTMVNRGNFEVTMHPGDAYAGENGYYSKVVAIAHENTQSKVLTQAFQDLGATNLVRYVDATNIVNAARTTGYSEGLAQGKSDWFNNSIVTNYTNSYGSVEADSITIIPDINGTYSKDTIVILSIAASKTQSLSTAINPRFRSSTEEQLAPYKVGDSIIYSKTTSSRVELRKYTLKFPTGVTIPPSPGIIVDTNANLVTIVEKIVLT